MNTQDKILNVVLENQSNIAKLDGRVSRLENLVEKTFKKIDDFLILINRHEAEICALRSRYERLSP